MAVTNSDTEVDLLIAIWLRGTRPIPDAESTSRIANVVCGSEDQSSFKIVLDWETMIYELAYESDVRERLLVIGSLEIAPAYGGYIISTYAFDEMTSELGTFSDFAAFKRNLHYTVREFIDRLLDRAEYKYQGIG